MAYTAELKSRRRRSLRESFPAPLNQIAMRHVDAVQSLSECQKAILAKAVSKVGIGHITTCLAALKKSGDSINNENDLIGMLDLSETPAVPSNETENVSGDRKVEDADVDYLASVLLKCYPDMPQASADALVLSEVMAPSLDVVATSRLALRDAKSDFVITALYTLFEEKLDEIEQIIANNPAFVKAMQLSRPDWKPN
jgi:hypothetical protein